MLGVSAVLRAVGALVLVGAAVGGVSASAQADPAPVAVACTVTTTVDGAAAPPHGTCTATADDPTDPETAVELHYTHQVAGPDCPTDPGAPPSPTCEQQLDATSSETATPSNSSGAFAARHTCPDLFPGFVGGFGYIGGSYHGPPSFSCDLQFSPMTNQSAGDTDHYREYVRESTDHSVVTVYSVDLPHPQVIPPVAAFTASSTSVPNQAAFDGSPSHAVADGASITAWHWDFGDGTTGDGRQVSHTYTRDGDETVTLTVTDSKGTKASTSRTIGAHLAIDTLTFDPAQPAAPGTATALLTVYANGIGSVHGVTPSLGVTDAKIATVGASTPAGADVVPGHPVTFRVALRVLQPGTTTVTGAAGGTSTSGKAVTATPVTATLTTGAKAPVVNSTGDAPAADDGSKGCDTGRTVTIGGRDVTECTLRAAIQAEDAGSVGDAKTITFVLPTGVDALVQPTSPLPALTAAGVTVDGAVPSGRLGNRVRLSGFSLPDGTPTLEVSGARDVVENLDFRANETELLVDAKAGHDTVRGVHFADASNIAVKIVDSPADVIGGTTPAARNTIVSSSVGIWVTGAAATGTQILGNWIGVDLAGDGSVSGGSVADGIVVLDASSTVIGGAASPLGAGAGNVIDPRSGGGGIGQPQSQTFGVFVAGRTTTVTGTRISGNVVGLLPDGATVPGGGSPTDGIAVSGRVVGAVVGGAGTGLGNVVRAANVGVEVSGTFVSSVQVLGNLVGTDATGAHCVIDAGTVDVVVAGARLTTVGTPGAGRNVLSCGAAGVVTAQTSSPTSTDGGKTPIPGTDNATQPASMSTLVSGNLVGPVGDGRAVDRGTDDTPAVPRIGIQLGGTGDTAGPNDQVAGNGIGILLGGAAETVVGELVGTDPLGTTAIPNGIGVAVSTAPAAAASATVRTDVVPAAAGASGAGAFHIGVPGAKANVISGNVDELVLRSPATVQNNRIGVAAGGLSVLPRASEADAGVVARSAGLSDYGPAVTVSSTAPGSVVGGPRPGQGNVVGGSTVAGIALGAAATVQGNDIGVGADGTTPVPNQVGVIARVSGATVGATPAAPTAGGNVIAHNRGFAVSVDENASGVTVLGDAVAANGAGIGFAGSTSNGGITAPTVSAAALNGRGGTAVAVDGVTAGQIVQVFAGNSCLAAHPAQGARLLLSVTTDAATADLTLPAVAVGSPLVATVTDKRGTSVFSGCSTVTAAPTGTVEDPTTSPGDTDTADGVGFLPGEQVDASLHSAVVDLGAFTADPAGRVHVAFTVPVDLPLGVHHLVLVGRTSGRAVSIPLTVVARGGGSVTDTSSADALAATGVDAWWHLRLALLLVLLGLVVLGGARVERRPRPRP